LVGLGQKVIAIKEICLQKFGPVSRLSRPLDIGTDTYRAATCYFLLTFQSNHGPTSYRFRDAVKNRKFCPPRVFGPPLMGFPLDLVPTPGVEKEVWRYLQPYGYNTCTWRTDRRTPAESKDRAYA